MKTFLQFILCVTLGVFLIWGYRFWHFDGFCVTIGVAVCFATAMSVLNSSDTIDNDGEEEQTLEERKEEAFDLMNECFEEIRDLGLRVVIPPNTSYTASDVDSGIFEYEEIEEVSKPR